jgi:hypothetical protein
MSQIWLRREDEPLSAKIEMWKGAPAPSTKKLFPETLLEKSNLTAAALA